MTSKGSCICTTAAMLVSASWAFADVRFARTVLDRAYRAEGVAVADVNRDGTLDLLTGEVWWEGPSWRMHEVARPGTYDPAKDRSTCYVNHACDVNGDGWVDSIVIGRPGGPCYWFENPGKTPGHWKRHLVCKSACNETPRFVDLFGTGRRVMVFGTDGRMCAFAPPGKAAADWARVVLTAEKAPGAERYGHGLGVGDVNGDGRADLVVTAGWWEAPADRTQTPWAFHKAKLGKPAAQMPVYDVDGDGDADVISSSAHKYGIWWHEQVREGEKISFREHEIARDFSQTHAVCLADINGDGRKDFVTGKRYFAHQGKDPGAREPAVLVWFELQRPAKGTVRFVPHEIDRDSGVGLNFAVADLNADGRPDVATANKKGVHVFLQAAGR